MRHANRLLPLALFVLLALGAGACELAPTPTPTIPFPTVLLGPTMAPSPTPPPLVPTSLPTCTDQASFDSDVSVPPGTVFLPGQPLVKTWRLRNAGTCTWNSDYALVFYTGDRMAGAALVPFPNVVTPGNTVDLSVALVAPAGTGTYEGRWLLRNARGEPFGIAESADGSFGVRIVVAETPSTPTVPLVTPTATLPAPTMPTAGPTPVITDWRGDYFGNPDLVGNPSLVRNDVSIDFDWGYGAPADGLPVDGFSVRWTRALPLEAGLYRFRAEVDDGVRLWVDDHLLLDDWHDGAPREVVGDWAVVAGSHTVRIEYYDRGGGALIRVWWDGLAAVYPDWEGQYWANADLRGVPGLVRNDTTIDFSWGTGSVVEGMPADNFSARWMRVATFEAATYRFHAIMDDAARVWVDNNLIVDSWSDGGPREVTADVVLADGVHLLRVEYYERGGEAQVHVWWEKQ